MASHNKSNTYDDEFYKGQKESSYLSAIQIIPFICSLFPFISKVVDIGCGSGSWLAPFANMGKVIAGYDFGDGVENNLYIPIQAYHKHDLTTPLDLKKQFDLAISLEVAEHLEKEHAYNLISILTNASDLILFSAAIPGQNGVHHVNCQWPDYWAYLFVKHGFSAYDILRPIFWRNTNIRPWYRQNIILYAKDLDIASRNRLSMFTNFQCLPIKIEF